MTPLNSHILTPKIHHVLSSLSRRRAAAPERRVYGSSRLTGTTLTSQSARTHPCTHTLGYPQTNTGERSCEIPWELPLKPQVPALARRRCSLALPVTPFAAGRTDKPKQRMGTSVGSEGCWSSSESLTQAWLLVVGLALCAGGKRKRLSG